jgi:ABC-type glycerol-3-phosphate transport system substrate-binding protein
VKAVAVRKSALVLIVLGVMLFILSPWTEAPPRISVPAPVAMDDSVAILKPVIAQAPSMLTVEAALGDAEFSILAEHNRQFMTRNRNVIVNLIQVKPEDAYRKFTESLELGDAADVMLVSNEWIQPFAVSGYLLPADAAFVGSALAEQFPAVAAPAKWNGYSWAVPMDFDPYVMVWNSTLLRSLLGDNVVFPLSAEQWELLAAKSEAMKPAASWLTLNPQDPLSLLAWLDNAAGQRSDILIDSVYAQWQGGVFDTALGILDRHKAGVTMEVDFMQAGRSAAEGKTAAAVIPFSTAARIRNETAPGSSIQVDRSSWNLPFVWPRGRSYVISSQTEVEEAAYAWIAEMTDAPAQIEYYRQFSLLPVYRSVYDGDLQLSNLLPSRIGQRFPNVPPQSMGPGITSRLAHLGELWREFAQGRLTMQDWKNQWLTNSTDF